MEIRQVGQQIVWCLNALLWMSSLIVSALIGCQCKVPLLSQYQSMASPQNIYSVILTLLSETIDSICFHVRKVLIRRLRWIFQVNRPKPPFIKINQILDRSLEWGSLLNGFQIRIIKKYVIDWWLVERHLIGCFWLFAFGFSKSGCDLRMVFCHSVNAGWDFGTLRGGGDT